MELTLLGTDGAVVLTADTAVRSPVLRGLLCDFPGERLEPLEVPCSTLALATLFGPAVELSSLMPEEAREVSLAANFFAMDEALSALLDRLAALIINGDIAEAAP